MWGGVTKSFTGAGEGRELLALPVKLRVIHALHHTEVAASAHLSLCNDLLLTSPPVVNAGESTTLTALSAPSKRTEKTASLQKF